MNEPAPDSPPTDLTGGIDLAGEDLERLRAAARWARLAVRAGTFALTLVLLLLLDVGLRNPEGLVHTANLQGTPNVLVAVLFLVASVGAVGLLWSYARNVTAFFVRGETALDRAFRRLRQFFVMWTWLTGVTAILAFLGALSFF